MADKRSFFATVVITLVSITNVFGQITPSNKFFGFKLGAGPKMARWDKIVGGIDIEEAKELRRPGVDVAGNGGPEQPGGIGDAEACAGDLFSGESGVGVDADGAQRAV